MLRRWTASTIHDDSRYAAPIERGRAAFGGRTVFVIKLPFERARRHLPLFRRRPRRWNQRRRRRRKFRGLSGALVYRRSAPPCQRHYHSRALGGHYRERWRLFPDAEYWAACDDAAGP